MCSNHWSRMGIAAVDSAYCSVVMLVVVVLQLGLVSVYSIDDAASMLLAALCAEGVALVAQWLCVAFNRCTMKAASMCWNGRLSVRMSACACS
jgi:hypothetical protein